MVGVGAKLKLKPKEPNIDYSLKKFELRLNILAYSLLEINLLGVASLGGITSFLDYPLRILSLSELLNPGILRAALVFYFSGGLFSFGGWIGSLCEAYTLMF